MRWNPRSALLFGVAGLGLLGCHADVDVLVQAGTRGRGVVRVEARLDPAAVTAVGTDATSVASKDLSAAGWAISGLRRLPVGGGVISAERRFATVAQANAALRQLSGPQGPLPSLRLSRSGGPFATTLHVQGLADLSKGLGAFGDHGLAAALASSSPLGIDDAAVALQTGASAAKAIRMRVITDLAGRRVTRTVPFGGSVRIDAARRTVSWVGIASLAAIVLGLGGAFALLRGVGSRGGRGTSAGSDGHGDVVGVGVGGGDRHG